MDSPNVNPVAARIASRMSHIAPFEVMEIQTAARELEKSGHDVIHMEIGEPDFGTPAPIVEAAVTALRSERMYYTSALGIAPLREAISAYYLRRFGVEVAPERIVVTAGSSAALLLAFGVLLDAGDEVLMADPGYPCNRHFVRALDGVPVAIPCDAALHYQLSAAQVDAHWREATVAALVASPSNPTGTVIAPQELARIHAEVRSRGGTLIVDEIYQGLIYGQEPTTALALGEDVFVVNSFSKYFQMTGWRLGWMVVPPAYTRHVEILAQNLYISPSTPAQYAALAAFDPATIEIVEARRRELQARRDFLIPALESIGFRVPVRPEGAFYIYADSSQLDTDSFKLAHRILQECGVAVTPGRDFGVAAPEKHIRFAYTQPIARLTEACERIRKGLSR
jgi:aspartate/methionine/tyrosine aminotransferase